MLPQHLLAQLDKVLDHRIRLAMAVALMAEPMIEFNAFKELLRVTDGNLASHVAALEKAGYVSVQKSFRGKKPLTQYSITPAGRAATLKHLDALETLLKSTNRRV